MEIVDLLRKIKYSFFAKPSKINKYNNSAITGSHRRYIKRYYQHNEENKLREFAKVVKLFTQ